VIESFICGQIQYIGIEKMKTGDSILNAYSIGFVIIVSIVTFMLMNNMINNEIVYECSQNDITTFEQHEVTFVTIDIEGNPYSNVLIGIAHNNKSWYNVTGTDGSCSFILDGRSRYVVRLYNRCIDTEKKFVLYPVNSCYLIVL